MPTCKASTSGLQYFSGSLILFSLIFRSLTVGSSHPIWTLVSACKILVAWATGVMTAECSDRNASSAGLNLWRRQEHINNKRQKTALLHDWMIIMQWIGTSFNVNHSIQCCTSRQYGPELSLNRKSTIWNIFKLTLEPSNLSRKLSLLPLPFLSLSWAVSPQPWTQSSTLLHLVAQAGESACLSSTVSAAVGDLEHLFQSALHLPNVE